MKIDSFALSEYLSKLRGDIIEFYGEENTDFVTLEHRHIFNLSHRGKAVQNSELVRVDLNLLPKFLSEAFTGTLEKLGDNLEFSLTAAYAINLHFFLKRRRFR